MKYTDVKNKKALNMKNIVHNLFYCTIIIIKTNTMKSQKNVSYRFIPTFQVLPDRHRREDRTCFVNGVSFPATTCREWVRGMRENGLSRQIQPPLNELLSILHQAN